MKQNICVSLWLSFNDGPPFFFLQYGFKYIQLDIYFKHPLR